MPGGPCTRLQSRLSVFLETTSVAVDEFQPLVLASTAALHAQMAYCGALPCPDTPCSLPADDLIGINSTVGSLRAHVQVECLVDVIDDLVSSDNPQDKFKRFTTALHEVFALSRSTKHMIQRPLGRLEPTPSLKYRAHEVMRNVPVMST